MKQLACIVSLLSVLVGSQLARAQPGATPPGSMPPNSTPPPSYGYGPSYGPPMPPPAPRTEREGWNIGFGLGVGSMDSSANGGFECTGCEVSPPTPSFDLHAGAMISARLALQGEIWFHSRALDVDGNATVQQVMTLFTAQYWPSPRVWLKAGVGFASLGVSYYDGFADRSDEIGSGIGMMAAVGYELMHSRGFGLDIQLKGGLAGYEDGEGEDVGVTVAALGLNWY